MVNLEFFSLKSYNFDKKIDKNPLHELHSILFCHQVVEIQKSKKWWGAAFVLILVLH
jgi:hypothetical protein